MNGDRPARPPCIALAPLVVRALLVRRNSRSPTSVAGPATAVGGVEFGDERCPSSVAQALRATSGPARGCADS